MPFLAFLLSSFFFSIGVATRRAWSGDLGKGGKPVGGCMGLAFSVFRFLFLLFFFYFFFF